MTIFEAVSKEMLMKWGDEKIEYMSSGSVILDAVLGQGIPLGRFLEIAGGYGVGKTTVVLHACRYACASGKKVIYLDFEKGVNDSQLEGIGLIPYREKKLFYLLKPHTFEDAELILDPLLDDPDLAYVVIDSVTAMLPAKMREKSIADIEPGLQARYASAFLLKYKGFAYETSTAFIFINQLRTKLNFRGQAKVEASGGFAQKYYSDIRLEMALEKKLERTENTLEGDKPVTYGANVKVWSIKNRYARPHVEGVVTLHYGKGVSNISAYIRWLTQRGYIVQGGGGYYTVKIGNKENKVRGQEGLHRWVNENMNQVIQLVESAGGFLLVKDIKP